MCLLVENICLTAEKEAPLSCRKKCQGGDVTFFSILFSILQKVIFFYFSIFYFIEGYQECLTKKVPWNRDLTKGEDTGHAEAWGRRRRADRTEEKKPES